MADYPDFNRARQAVIDAELAQATPADALAQVRRQRRLTPQELAMAAANTTAVAPRGSFGMGQRPDVSANRTPSGLGFGPRSPIAAVPVETQQEMKMRWDRESNGPHGVMPASMDTTPEDSGAAAAAVVNAQNTRASKSPTVGLTPSGRGLQGLYGSDKMTSADGRRLAAEGRVKDLFWRKQMADAEGAERATRLRNREADKLAARGGRDAMFADVLRQGPNADPMMRDFVMGGAELAATRSKERQAEADSQLKADELANQQSALVGATARWLMENQGMDPDSARIAAQQIHGSPLGTALAGGGGSSAIRNPFKAGRNHSTMTEAEKNKATAWEDWHNGNRISDAGHSEMQRINGDISRWYKPELNTPGRRKDFIAQAVSEGFPEAMAAQWYDNDVRGHNQNSFFNW
ncbi:MAG: hypothetical protein JSS27_15445 [Planctomycetes bacterium]|nr:hypothetical protein [Planctomycetota bacterium]